MNLTIHDSQNHQKDSWFEFQFDNFRYTIANYGLSCLFFNPLLPNIGLNYKWDSVS